MNNLSKVTPLSAEGAHATIVDTQTVRFHGVISMRSPSTVFGPFLRAVHDAALADRLREIRVDVTELSFMNSSSIRLLVDWVEWVRVLPEGQRYTICFVTNPEATWQQTTFSVLKSFGGDHVQISPKPRSASRSQV